MQHIGHFVHCDNALNACVFVHNAEPKFGIMDT